MDKRKLHHRKNPRLNANILSKLFFIWIIPYVLYGNKHDLQTKDAFQLAPENQTEPLGDKLEKCWKAEVKESKEKKRRPCLWKVIVKTFGCIYLKYTLLILVATCIPMLLPIALKLLISYFDVNATSTMMEAYVYALMVTLVVTMESLFANHTKISMLYIGGQVKTACSAIIYRKVLRLPINCQNKLDEGKIITLLSNDVAQFLEVLVFFHIIFISPIMLTMNSIVIWRNLGATAVVTVLIVILQYIPFQVYSTRLMTKLREKSSQKTDHRLMLMAEIINGIRVIKMYAWEKPMEQLVLLDRRKELDLIAKKLYFIVGFRAFFKSGQSISFYLTLVILILCRDDISSAIVFPLIQYNFYFNLYTGYLLSICLSRLANAKAAINRIEDFLMLEEITATSKLCYCSSNNIVISLENITVCWSENNDHDVLKNISLSIAPKKLYALVGEIGAGKSSLLKVILGELHPKSGQVLNYGTTSFANQDPWLFNGSIRSNILLGEPFNEEKYSQVVSSCALLKDFEQLPHGDKTTVGEGGAALSGGQSARINLARAVYRNADVYLLDDPLASIDYCVGNYLFDNCLNGLLKDKTRILVTQKLEYIEKADEIILINNGQIQYQGNYEHFKKLDFFEYLSRNRDVDNHKLSKDDHQRSHDSISSFVDVVDEKDENTESAEIQELLSEYKNNEQLKSYKDPEKEIELIKRRAVPLSILLKFYNNRVLIAFTITFLIITHSCSGGFDYLVATWSENQDKYVASSNSTTAYSSNTSSNFVNSQVSLFYVIGGVAIGMVISGLLEIILFVQLHRKSCEILHNCMITRLLRATIQFFDIHDSGRILNRFSRDLIVVDEIMPVMMMEVVKVSIHVLIVFLQVLVTSSYMGIPLFVLICLVCGIITFFSKSIRSTTRLEAKAKSAVLSHISTTLNGRITIRSAGAESIVQRTFNDQQDNYMAACFTSIDVFASYCLWMELILLNFGAFLSFFLIFLKSTGITSATAGYILTQIFMISRYIFVGVMYVTKFDALMTSTERTFEYTELEQENIENNCLSNISSTWPSNGSIKFDHLYLIYSNSAVPTLKNINIVIEHGMKVGIIGRTGAGKSSLATALFRLAKTEGSLLVDGIDTKTVPLKDLRSKISILPQKSTLFSTSLRKNLDPLNLFDDAKIWSTLKSVRLDNNFQTLDDELDKKCLSSGQRQLLCLARAILKNNKILILDEATASMDTRTDDLIQSTIRENFKDCTILTIAHKLNSVINCDKILVVDGGQVIEYDEPSLLLRQSNSYFYKMWQALYSKS